MNVSTFLAYEQPTLSYCGVHHELLAHKPYESGQEEGVTALEPELDLSTITTAARSQQLP